MATTKVMRDRLRVAHLGEAAVLTAYIYTPLGDMSVARAVVRFALVPAMVLSGFVMWKLPVLRSRLRGSREGSPVRAA
jgi:hypothetical protein